MDAILLDGGILEPSWLNTTMQKILNVENVGWWNGWMVVF